MPPNEQTTDTTPAATETTTTTDQAAAGGAGAGTNTTSIPELDGLSEFTYQGQKYNPDRLQQIFGEHKTYSESHRQYQEAQKYEKNLQIDLENVLQDPRLATQFKQIYPKQYHWLCDRLLQSKSPGAAQTTTQGQSAQTLPKEFMDEFGNIRSTVQMLAQQNFEAKVEAANARLDAVLPPLFKKYPLASEDQVYARAEAILGKDKNAKITDQAWERMIRESHDAYKKKSDQFYNTTIKQQLERGKSGRDTAPGGATPGQAPVKPKTFDEAREAMIRHLRGNKAS